MAVPNGYAEGYHYPQYHLRDAGPTNMNIPVTIGDITSVAVNWRELGFGGYLDIGLYDTMEGLFVNFIGALVFSFIGYFYIKRRGGGRSPVYPHHYRAQTGGRTLLEIAGYAHEAEEE